MKVVGRIYGVVVEHEGERRLLQPLVGDETFDALWPDGIPFDLNVREEPAQSRYTDTPGVRFLLQAGPVGQGR